ncbi:hypothetical protein AnigIFM56816_008705 [Aspergillus niger]|uniref:Nucleolar protein 12-domain-containing protein n=1 Tax=Aspergillus niger TaxID=5061 RepID=A0A9W5ZVA6_ASPNG|nr:hypothetical protein CBS147320_6729 [Aspergillus niger]GKZ83610.1 hypothetical protein AnigIFM56816_008705 [Aspergillus niger]GLA27629.1 hypothetical protein AnigIFM63326_004844 [Aspergillus niger]GLA46938.1 hypothetical protein AnigIFM63604_000420 [Aspergillus niger]
MGPAAKRRKVASKVEEVTFDAADRQQFLTGFRKRKQQRIKHAQEIAEQKAREIKREERKRIREERTAEFQRALEEHKQQLKRLKEEEDSDEDNSSSGSEDEGDQEWEGFEEPPAVDYEAEYIDEDKYTTVTVEEMDPSREGLLRSVGNESDEEGEEQTETKPAPDTNSNPAGDKTKKKKTDNKPKKKKKKFRYETKEERKLTRVKERAAKSRKAQARRDRS